MLTFGKYVSAKGSSPTLGQRLRPLYIWTLAMCEYIIDRFLLVNIDLLAPIVLIVICVPAQSQH